MPLQTSSFCYHTASAPVASCRLPPSTHQNALSTTDDLPIALYTHDHSLPDHGRGSQAHDLDTSLLKSLAAHNTPFPVQSSNVPLRLPSRLILLAHSPPRLHPLPLPTLALTPTGTVIKRCSASAASQTSQLHILAEVHGRHIGEDAIERPYGPCPKCLHNCILNVCLKNW